MNIDAQDNQDGRLLQETLTRAMIACGFKDVREHKPAVSGKILCILCIDVNQKIYPCLTMNRFPATRRRRLFQVSSAPALPCGSFEGETGFVSDKLSIPFQPLFFQSVETVLRHPNPGFVSGKFGPRPPGWIIQGQNKRKSTIPSQPWHPVAVKLNALVALRRS